MGATLRRAGFISKGTFNRPGTPAYVKRMSKPRSSPYIDSVMLAVLKQQGFDHIKFEPANLYDPEQMYEALARYGQDVVDVVEDEALSRAWGDAFAAFARPKNHSFLELVSDEELPHAIKGSKSAGLGYVGNKAVNFQTGLRRSYDVLKRLKAPNPCTAFTRTSAGGKTRLVWGYPLEMTLIEARFARPLINYFMRANSPIAFGQPKFQIGAVLKFRVCTRPHIYALDFSKFDATVQEYFIRKAFEILSTWFRTEDRERYGWQRVIDYFIRTPIVMPDGKLYVGKVKGVPSGSYFTQLIDSIVNFVVLKSVFYRLGSRISNSRILVLGDDSIFSCDDDIPLNVLKEEFAKYGMILNVSKSKRNELHFLGANWDCGFPDISVEQILTKAVCPENPRTHLYVSSQDRYTRWMIARSILANYAAAYLSGWRVYVRSGNIMWHQDFVQVYCRGDTHLTGLEKVWAVDNPKYVERLRSAKVPLSVRLAK